MNGKALLSKLFALILIACLHVDGQEGLRIGLQSATPAIRWANTNGVQFQLLRSSSLPPTNWQVLVNLTGDPKKLRWTDEFTSSGNSFYRWRIEAPQTRTHKWQTVLDGARTTARIKGAMAVVISTNGMWDRHEWCVR